MKSGLTYIFCCITTAISFNATVKAQVHAAASFSMDTTSTLTIFFKQQPLLTYQHQLVYPPAGVDTIYKRSGFIHPLYTPNGQVLTQIQPADHYHHYGIWNPWTHTLFEKDTVDFWNLHARKGTVRFVRFTEKKTTENFAIYTALQEHVVLYKNNTEKTALKEWQTVKVYTPDSLQFVIDISSKFTCATNSPVQLLTYRYGGGLGWRATDFWNKDNCEVFTSEGKNRSNTDGSTARWVVAQGVLPGNDRGGMIILSHPGNYNHPEPLRIWDANGNKGRGDLFLNFSPTKTKDWVLTPGNEYVLKYRLVVFNGKTDSAKVNTAWNNYVQQVK